MIINPIFIALGFLSAAQAIKPFTWNSTTFLLHGEPFQIIGGQMDPQRIPNELWADRLAKARAMGLNTIFSYVYWDQLVPEPGAWETTGNNNIARYFKIAQEQGLHIVLRSGPYICGEHEWGGFPAWLSEVPGMVVRTSNKPYLAAAKYYIDHLGEELRNMMITNGGPILMAQVENEYGSYGDDHAYITSVRDMISQAYGIPLYTNDGGEESMLDGGQIAGALAEIDGSPQTGFAARNKYVTDPSSLGPLLDGEYYVTWLDQWASNYTHETDVGNTAAIQQVTSDLDWILRNAICTCSTGARTGGFQNGADWGDALEPITTSYDYGAPLDESGRTNEIYHAIRKTIGAYVGADTIPALVPESPLIDIPAIKLEPAVNLFDALPDPILKTAPVNMEAVGQSTGFILYRHVATATSSGLVKAGDQPRDRVLIYVNGKRVGVIDSTYEVPNSVSVTLKNNDILDLLIENLGRVNFGSEIIDQRKGVVGNITVGGTVLSNWGLYPLPFTSLPAAAATAPQVTTNSAPIFYTASFDVDAVGDTFLELPGWKKGVVWVNGVNLGRYWVIGPQQTLYLPGVYLRETGNNITVLALEPTGDEGEVRGITTRNWGNNPDPDM
ncbi:hypothetical protein N7454_000844 [Penicillium verhagenii]|nr:hypothetical protein N7454_000844 [Penicillium verhagenii]